MSKPEGGLPSPVRPGAGVAPESSGEGTFPGPRDASATQGPGDAAVIGDVPPVPEAEAPVVPTTPVVVPLWAMPLVGHYAFRATALKQDDFNTVTSAEELGVAEFKLGDSGQMLLHSTVCSMQAVNSFATLTCTSPASLPRRIETVTFADAEQRFATEGPPVTTGFTRQPPASCEGKLGQLVPSPPDQASLGVVTCRCASEDEPPLVDDCRVLDPDRDKKPGLTYELRGMGTRILDGTLYGGSENGSHYTNGLVGGDGARHTANIDSVEINHQFGCEPAAICADIAKLGKPCGPSHNTATFVRIEPPQLGVDPCEAVVKDRRTLFRDPAPPPPPRCL